jgi:hypothetical protein
MREMEKAKGIFASRRGQMSIEYLSIIAIMLMLFSVMSLDLMRVSLANLTDLQRATIWKANSVAVLAGVQTLKFHPTGSTKRIYIRSPPDCEVSATASVISLVCEGVPTNSITNSPDPSVTFYLEEGALGSGELKPVMLTKG